MSGLIARLEAASRDERLSTGGLYLEAAAALRKAAAERDAVRGFKDAVIDALVVGCILTAEHETNPRKAIADLLAWEVKIALDPAVSSEAATLRDTYKAELDEAHERGARLARWMEDAQRERDEAHSLLRDLRFLAPP